MSLLQSAQRSFVLLHAEWPVARGAEIIHTAFDVSAAQDRPDPTHAIVVQHAAADAGSRTDYFLVALEEALDQLTQFSEAGNLGEALSLQADRATAVAESGSGADRWDRRCVVVEEGRVIGFLDLDRPAMDAATRRAEAVVPEVEVATPETVTRSLLVDFPDRVSTGQQVSLLASLSALPAAQESAGFAAAVGTTVTITVRARRGFEIVGANEGQLTVAAEQTEDLRFVLRATDLGPGQIVVQAFQDNIHLARLTLAPMVEAAPAGAPSDGDRHEVPLAAAPAGIPDISLLIEEELVDGKVGFTIRVLAPQSEWGVAHQKFGPLKLDTEPGEFFQAFYEDIDNLPLGSPNERAIAMQRLANKGSRLFRELLPPDVQQLFWNMRDRISTVLIQSEEPWIPWELCKLETTENGRVVTGPFLCEAFALTRSVPGQRLWRELKLRNIAVVVPSGSGLSFAPEEREFLLSLKQDDAQSTATRNVSPVAARFVDVFRELSLGVYDGWHFTGHGSRRDADPDQSEMVLENDEKFRPEDIAGEAANLGLARPLVFLNACQIGQSDKTLTGVGGWAQRFLQAGAAGFIGAYWKVFDKSAHQFAREVYNRLLAGVPIGQAVREARLAIKDSGDPTWLAYTVFADPLATVPRS